MIKVGHIGRRNLDHVVTFSMLKLNRKTLSIDHNGEMHRHSTDEAKRSFKHSFCLSLCVPKNLCWISISFIIFISFPSLDYLMQHKIFFRILLNDFYHYHQLKALESMVIIELFAISFINGLNSFYLHQR